MCVSAEAWLLKRLTPKGESLSLELNLLHQSKILHFPNGFTICLEKSRTHQEQMHTGKRNVKRMVVNCMENTYIHVRANTGVKKILLAQFATVLGVDFPK